MVLRKINAGISLIITFLLMDHAIFHAAWMLSRGSIAKTANNLPRILFMLMMAHAVISIVLAVLGHKGAEKRKCNSYSKLNIPTNIQRIGGILMILFTVLHIAGTIGLLQPPQIVHAVLPPLFFALALMHVAISASKAFVTLGIGNATFIKFADILVKVLCVATWIADVIGFYLYLC